VANAANERLILGDAAPERQHAPVATRLSVGFDCDDGDATNEHYNLFFAPQEGTALSFQGIRDVIKAKGLFCSLYTDLGSHYWHTLKAGGKVDKVNLSQVGRAMKQSGSEMIAAYSSEALGCSERLVKELALLGITDMMSANRYLREQYLPASNAEFMPPALKEGSRTQPSQIDDILCEHHERVVGKDNGVSFAGIKLQIPQDRQWTAL